MNILVAGEKQILFEENWYDRLRIKTRHSGNEMLQEDIKELSNRIDLDALKGYRSAVGQKTQEIINRVDPDKYKDKVLQSRINKVIEEGAVVESAYAVADYWSKRTIAGLFLMPATRHNIVHLNEALQLNKSAQ